MCSSGYSWDGSSCKQDPIECPQNLKPAEQASCGKCGTQRKKVSCDETTGKWKEENDGSCVEAEKVETEEACGCKNGGKKTRTPQCRAATGTTNASWSEPGWGECSISDECSCDDTKKPELTRDCGNKCGKDSGTAECETTTGKWMDVVWSGTCTGEGECAAGSANCNNSCQCETGYTWDGNACTSNKTACPLTCTIGHTRNPKIQYEEDGVCCIDSCQLPELRETCSCVTYAMRMISFCECKSSSVFKEIMARRYQYDPPELIEEMIARRACKECDGYLDSNRAFCCKSMGGELNPRDNKCYSTKMTWEIDYNDSCGFPALCYSGHCVHAMGPVASQGCRKYDACPFTGIPSNPRECKQEGTKCNSCITSRRPEIDERWCDGQKAYGTYVYGWTCKKDNAVIF
jgi:hypothetical protein